MSVFRRVWRPVGCFGALRRACSAEAAGGGRVVIRSSRLRARVAVTQGNQAESCVDGRLVLRGSNDGSASRLVDREYEAKTDVSTLPQFLRDLEARDIETGARAYTRAISYAGTLFDRHTVDAVFNQYVASGRRPTAAMCAQVLQCCVSDWARFQGYLHLMVGKYKLPMIARIRRFHLRALAHHRAMSVEERYAVACRIYAAQETADKLPQERDTADPTVWHLVVEDDATTLLPEMVRLSPTVEIAEEHLSRMPAAERHTRRMLTGELLLYRRIRGNGARAEEAVLALESEGFSVLCKEWALVMSCYDDLPSAVRVWSAMLKRLKLEEVSYRPFAALITRCGEGDGRQAEGVFAKALSLGHHECTPLWAAMLFFYVRTADPAAFFTLHARMLLVRVPQSSRTLKLCRMAKELEAWQGGGAGAHDPPRKAPTVDPEVATAMRSLREENAARFEDLQWKGG